MSKVRFVRIVLVAVIAMVSLNLLHDVATVPGAGDAVLDVAMLGFWIGAYRWLGRDR